MRFKQVVHPEIVALKKGDEVEQSLYKFVLPSVKWDDEAGAFSLPIHLMHDMDDILKDHICLVKRFQLDQGKIYHVCHDFLSEIAKIDRQIPVDHLPKRFCGYISFAPKTIKDDASYVIGAYVYLGPIRDTSFATEGIDLDTPVFWVSYLTESFTVTGLRVELENQRLTDLINKHKAADYEYDGDHIIEVPIPPDSANARDVVFRTLLNICCYINQPDPDLKRVQPAKQYSHSQRSKMPIVNESTLPVTFINWAWQRPMKEHVVSGHFKWVACGEHHAKRKLIWINAYPRGG